MRILTMFGVLFLDILWVGRGELDDAYRYFSKRPLEIRGTLVAAYKCVRGFDKLRSDMSYIAPSANINASGSSKYTFVLYNSCCTLQSHQLIVHLRMIKVTLEGSPFWRLEKLPIVGGGHLPVQAGHQ
jgi:hypothetical protein